MYKTKKLITSKWHFISLGLVLGGLIILAIRFFTYAPIQVHYHANFAVFINGQRQEFKDSQYYQPETACMSTNDIAMPEQRAHMHDNINSLVHVHDHATTWGQFFESLGWYVGPNFIQTADDTMYQASGSNLLHITINDQDYTGLTPLTNMMIQDKSRVLISFGDLSSSQLASEFKQVPATAAKHDSEKDPASCSGSEPTTVSARLHHLF